MAIVTGADRLGRLIYIDNVAGTFSYEPPEPIAPLPVDGHRAGEIRPPPCLAAYELVVQWYLLHLKREPNDYNEALGYGRFGLPCSVIEAEIASSPEAEAKRLMIGPVGPQGPAVIPGFLDPNKVTAPTGFGIVVDAIIGRLGGPIGDVLRIVQRVDEALGGRLAQTLKPLLDMALAPGAVITQRLAEALASVTPLALDAVRKTVEEGMKATRAIAEQAASLGDVGKFAVDLITGNREGIVNALGEALTNGFGTGLLSALHEMEGESVEEFAAMAARMAGVEGVPPEIKRVLQRAANNESPAPFIVAIAGLAVVLMMVQGPLLHSEMEKIRQQSGYHNTSYIISPTEAAEVAVRNLRDYDAMREIAQRNGLDANQFRMMADLAFRFPSPEAIITAELRGIIDGETAERWLNRQNYDAESRTALRQLGQVLPGIQDLITMAVKGAFTPAEIETFQLGEDLPEDFVRFAAQQGYSREWAQRSWYQHWQLPSPNQVFEMFQRGVIEQDIVDLYLKAADYSVFWRESLRKIAYNVLGRIDIRRIHDLRDKDRAWLVRRHLDLGYSPDDAEELSEFTIALNDDDRKARKRDLTLDLKGRVVGGIVSGMFTEEEASPLLDGMGYSAEQVSDLVIAGRLIRAQEYDQRVTDLLGDLYVKGRKTRIEVADRLRLAGLNDAEMEKVFMAWDLERELRAPSDSQEQERDLTKAEILSAMAEGIFSTAETRVQLLALRYDEKEVDALVSLRMASETKAAEKEQIEVTHRKFLRGLLDRAGAAVELGRVTDRPTQIESLLLRWEAEKEAKDFDLSVAQVGEAFQRAIMDETETRDYLSNLGATDREAEVLLLLWNAKGAEASVRQRKVEEAEERRHIAEAERVLAKARRDDKQLAQTDLFKALNAEVLTEEQVRKELIAKGYSLFEVDTLMATNRRAQEARSARK